MHSPKYEREYTAMLQSLRGKIRVAKTSQSELELAQKLLIKIIKSPVLDRENKSELTLASYGSAQLVLKKGGDKSNPLRRIRKVLDNLNAQHRSDMDTTKLEQVIIALEDVYQTIKEF